VTDRGRAAPGEPGGAPAGVGAVTLLLALVLAAPAPEFALFDGLPLARPAEILALAVLAPLLASRRLRRAVGREWRAWPASRRRILAGGLLAAGVLKGVLLVSGAVDGFPACYRSPVVRQRGRAHEVPWAALSPRCEASYANPLGRLGVTRIDRTLDFGETDWNLIWRNARRFNIYPWVGGNIWRSRLPFQADWSGEVALDAAATVRLTYAGEGVLRVAGREWMLEPRYDAARAVEIALPPGRHRLEIRYRFDDGSRVGRPTPGPYAVFRVHRVEADGRAAPLRAAPPALAWRLLAALGDGLLAGALALAGASLARLLWPLRLRLAVAAAVIGAVFLYETRAAPLQGAPGLLAVAVVLLVGLGRGSRLRRTLGAWAALLAASLARTAARVPSFATVVYWEGGSDSLSYDGFAYEILASWSLRGGEGVFIRSPAYRYLRFLEHLVLGDGHPLIVSVAVAGLHLALLWAALHLYPRGSRGWVRRALAASAAVLLLWLASGQPVLANVEYGLSEYPTWVLQPVAVTLLFAGRSRAAVLGGGLLLTLAALARANQAPALVAMFAAGVARLARRRPRRALAAVALCGAAALLPAAHNLYYGGRVVPILAPPGSPTSWAMPRLIEFPPARLARVATDPETRRVVRERLRGLTYRIRDRGDRGRWVRPAFHGLELAWLVALGAVLLRRWRLDWPGVLLVAAPLLFLGFHLFYQLRLHYPRHIVAGHVAMGLVTMFAASHAARRDQRRT
jgi:hypothetical protein